MPQNTPIYADGMTISQRKEAGMVKARVALVDKNYKEIAYGVLSLEQLQQLRAKIDLAIEAILKRISTPHG